MDQLIKVERGATPLMAVQPKLLAQWIVAVNVEATAALEALRRSLLVPGTPGVYAESPSRAEAEGIDAHSYIRAVAQFLGLDVEENDPSADEGQGPRAES